MQQIADWLKTLGMSEYAQRFAENDIDIAVLPHLTDQHLKDLGVSLGHRLKMLHAIAQLAGAAPATPQPAPVTEPMSQDTAERRQITVMFSDLVGSTALSAKRRTWRHGCKGLPSPTQWSLPRPRENRRSSNSSSSSRPTRAVRPVACSALVPGQDR